MSNRAWMPLDIDDYMADTMHLSAAEHGAYMLLIMRYWKDGGLPSDERMIQRYSRLSPEQWADSRDILAAFFEDGWRHRRIDAELAKADEIIAKRRKAADARHNGSKSNAHAEQVQSKSTYTGASPLTKEPEKEEPNGSSKKRGCRLPDDFEPDLDFAESQGLSRSQAEREAASFRDYWPAQPGQRGVKTDWQATWRNWARKAAERHTQPVRGSPSVTHTRPDPFKDLAQELSDGQTRSSRSNAGHWDDAQGIPLIAADYQRR